MERVRTSARSCNRARPEASIESGRTDYTKSLWGSLTFEQAAAIVAFAFAAIQGIGIGMTW